MYFIFIGRKKGDLNTLRETPRPYRTTVCTPEAAVGRTWPYNRGPMIKTLDLFSWRDVKVKEWTFYTLFWRVESPYNTPNLLYYSHFINRDMDRVRVTDYVSLGMMIHNSWIHCDKETK